MTTDLPARLKAYNGYDPVKRFKFIASKEVVNRRKAETWLMHDLKMKSTMQSNEWFHIPQKDAFEIFERVS